MEQTSKVMEVSIDEIVIGKRIRENPTEEDLVSLRESIKSNGLLQPIVVNNENKLIGGFRRYTCCKALGYQTIPASQVYTENETQDRVLELLENLEREDFTFSEKMKAAAAIESDLAELAEKRMHDKNASETELYGVLITKGKTRDYMGQILKIGSGKTYDHAREIWKKQDQDILHKLDEKKITINRAYKMVTGQANKASQAEETPSVHQENVTVSIMPLLKSLEQVIHDGSYDIDELKEVQARLQAILGSIETLMVS